MLTSSETTKLLGISERALEYIVKKGLLPTTAKGEFSLESVRQFMNLSQFDEFKADAELTDDARYRLEKEAELKREVSKWERLGYLDQVGDADKANLAKLLTNTQLLAQQSEEFNPSNASFTCEEYLWMVHQMWVRSKLKKLVNIQVMEGPTAIVYSGRPTFRGWEIGPREVVAKSQKLNFCFFPGAKFENVKEAYADALAQEMDRIIFAGLYHYVPCSNDFLLDKALDKNSLSNLYDYVVVSKQIRCLLEKSHSEIDIYDLPCVSLDEESFTVKMIAGRYPVSTLMPPIFMPYVMVTSAEVNGFCYPIMRHGWCEEFDLKPHGGSDSQAM